MNARERFRIFETINNYLPCIYCGGEKKRFHQIVRIFISSDMPQCLEDEFKKLRR